MMNFATAVSAIMVAVLLALAVRHLAKHGCCSGCGASCKGKACAGCRGLCGRKEEVAGRPGKNDTPGIYKQ